MATFVVCWDGDVDKFGGGICVAEGDDRDVDVGSFFDGLSIGPWVGDDDQSWFFEGAGDVVGEVSRSKTTCNRNGAGMSSEFENSPLAVRTRRDDTDVGWVVDSGDDSGSKNNLFPVCTWSSV